MKQSIKTKIQLALSYPPPKSLDYTSLIPAAVLLLVYPKNDEYCILLNKRSNTVKEHKGEISFPGGRMGRSDQTKLETALRETHEEMGIVPEDVELLGRLDEVSTISHYVISTFVGTIPYPYNFSPNRDEVSEVLETPISALRDQKNLRNVVRIINGIPISSAEYAYEGHLIFGATAKLLTLFLELTNVTGSEGRL